MYEHALIHKQDSVNPACCRLRERRAFTLLELMLVLGLIVVLVGLGIPGMRRIYVQNQLKSTTQEFQGVLYKTRLEAMKTGKPLVFRYRGGSSVFEVVPKDVFEQRKKSQEGIGAVSYGPELLNDAPLPETASGIYERMLPHQIVFGFPPEVLQPSAMPADVFASTEMNPDASLAEEWTSDSGSIKAESDGWSEPVLFFPNGRTSQAVLELQTTGSYNYRRQLTLRGLTGTAVIADVPNK